MTVDVADGTVALRGIEKTKGSLIAKVSENTPAAEAGLEQDDVIVEFNGVPVEDVGQLRHQVAMTAPANRYPS